LESSRNWRNRLRAKLVTPQKALAHIKNGQTIFVGSGAGEPELLTRTLAEMADNFWDVEVIHLTSAREESILAHPNLVEHFRYNTFYIGRGLYAALAAGNADYTPMNISELPAAIADGIVNIDVTLIQVSTPDSSGMCSLGTSVDAARAAVEHAHLVIAQVNENVPRTMGDSMIALDKIDFLVAGDLPLIEVAPREIDAVSFTIGRHVASLVGDGMCLHFDLGSISAATMRYLDTKRDLGVHTEVLTDDILRLIKSGAVTNARKNANKDKTVATMVLGSQELYRTVDCNPLFCILPIDRVDDPATICQNDNMVAVQEIREIELTGLARADTQDICEMRSLPSSMDFIDGARRSRGGFSVVALPSTSQDGQKSQIVALSTGGGVAISRSKIDYVVTEYGVVNIHGRSVRERAIALISIAHPRFRSRLLEEAKSLKYVGPKQVIPPEHGCVYPSQYEFRHKFKDGTELSFRPVKPSDARRLQRMFYRLSPESVRMRYHGTIKKMTNEMAQKMAAIDYSRDMAIVGLAGPRINPRIVAEGRYMCNPANNMGEFDIVVDEEFRGHGIGTLLANHLNKIAYSRGLSGVYAEVISRNAATIALLGRAWPTAKKIFGSDSCTFTLQYDPEDVKRPKDSIIVYSGRYGDYSYGEDHPFNPARTRAAMQMISRQGQLDEPWMRVEEPRMISKERLIESNSPAFIDALQRANSGVWQEDFLKFHLGGDECPIFPGLFDYVMLYTSATCTGVDLIMNENANVVFNPLGGFHHAGRDHAEGFCYVNDVIVAIDRFLTRGFRVAYVDIDAHHGNGVQDAFYTDDRLLFISLHQSGKTLYPWGGFEDEIGDKIGRGYTINIPLPEQTDDEAYEMVFKRIVPPALDRFAPSVLIVVVGTDTHKADPLANLSLTNNGMVAAIKLLRDRCPQILLLGGGGYDQESVVNGWSRIWAAANRIDSLPDHLLVMGGSFLGARDLEGAEIVDMQYNVTGETKNKILEELDRIASYHEKNTLPLIGRSKRVS